MALLSRFLILLVAALSLASAMPEVEDKNRPKCRNKLQRKAWHKLSKKEKKAYIDAELCLMKKPAKLGLPGATVRFEELQANHQIQAAITHNVGAFLPFHRLLMHAHEKLLREECGYTGAQPYWYEQRDAGKFYKADVFDPVTGFGGFGNGSSNCITDGPFAWFVNHLGPGYRIGPQCIYRHLNDTLSLMAGQKYIDACYKRTKFVDAWLCIELGPHISGHGGAGGKMQDPIASPGDPLFYLHHTWLDKVFWDWQALDLPKRLHEIGGPNAVFGPPPTDFPPPSPPPCTGLPCIGDPPIFLPTADSVPPFDAMIPPANAPGPAGDPGNVTTLSHILNMYGVIPNRTIGEVMDIGNALLCYEYV